MSRNRGQATVELALCLPLLCTLLLGVVQVAVIARDHLAVQLAAREAARSAAIGATPVGARRAATDAVALSPLDVRVDTVAGMVHAHVRFTDHTEVPLVGALLPDVDVEAAVTMALEPP